MKNTNKPSKYGFLATFAFLLILAVATLMPARAHAFQIGQLIDPLCLFACDKADPGQIIDPLCVFACDNGPIPDRLVDPLCVFCDNNQSNNNDHYNNNHNNHNNGGGNQTPNPTVNISANPPSVDYGDSSSIYWNSNNATYCFASSGSNNWAGSRNTSGTFYTGSLTYTTTFYINCSNNTGSVTDSVTVYVDNNNDNNNDDDNVSVSLRADDTSIDSDDETTIRWSSTGATRCDASGGTNNWDDDNIGTHGTFDTGSLDDDETYRITCENRNGDTDTDSITIRVDDNNDNNNNNDAPDVSTRNATNVQSNSATLNGQVDGNGHTTRAWFEYGTNTNFGYSTSQTSYGSRSTNYSKSISGLIPNATYYFRAVAENSEDTMYGNILSFNTGNDFAINNNQPIVVISADQTTLPYNASTNIRWSTTSATSCYASGGSIGWAGAKNIGSGFFNTGLLTSSRTFTITCTNGAGSSSDSVTISVRSQVVATVTNNNPTPALTSLLIVNSSIDRNQPIVPTLDNTRPHPGDEINYTVGYQNIGTGSITNLTLQISLPQEVSYMSSNGTIPSVFGNTLIFNLGTLRANSQGTVTVRAFVRENIPAGTNLNFPATLSYINAAGQPQSVNANVSAQVASDEANVNNNSALGASTFGAGFLPTNLFGWLLLTVLVLLLILAAKYLLLGSAFPFSRQTITTYDPSGEKTHTTLH